MRRISDAKLARGGIHNLTSRAMRFEMTLRRMIRNYFLDQSRTGAILHRCGLAFAMGVYGG
jgi:hypothetical protein